MCVVQFGEADQISIRADNNELASLTDLWKQAGSPDSRRPKDWLYTKEAIEFVEHIKNLKGGDSPLLVVKAGRSGGTFADPQIALKYAQYLSPNFQKIVNDVFIERIEEEIDPELGVQRAVERHSRRLKAIGRDDQAIAKRLKTVEKRNTLTSTLRDHGVTGSKFYWENGFAQVTEAEYLGWKGKKTSDLKKDLGIEKGNLRDHLSDWDLDPIPVR